MEKHLISTHLQTILPPIKHLIDKKAEAVDWNENDPSAKGYIRNRPFYEIKEVKDFFNESIFLDDGGLYLETSSNFPGRINLVAGETYQVVWDDLAFSCVAYLDAWGEACIGSQEIGNYLGGYEFSDTIVSDEPFFIVAWNDGQYWAEIYSEPNATHHFVISGIVTEIHKIDEKFIPLQETVGIFGTGSLAEVFNGGSPERASAYASHAEGAAFASGDYSHAEGYNTEATNFYAHSEGDNTRAAGESSHAEGRSTIAASNQQHVQGKFNIPDSTGTYAHIVGNGSLGSQSNAHTLDWNGNAWYQGDVFVGGTDQNSGERLAKMSDLAGINVESITTDEIDVICGVTLGINELIDETSGATYQLYVDSGKLSMREVE